MTPEPNSKGPRDQQKPHLYCDAPPADRQDLLTEACMLHVLELVDELCWIDQLLFEVDQVRKRKRGRHKQLCRELVRTSEQLQQLTSQP